MKHKSSHHANVLMNGHNPEHSHHENKSHRGTSNVHHHMKDDHHSSHHGSSAKPCDILMRQHHFSGGITNTAPHYAKGGKAHRTRRYAEGGHVDEESHGGSPRSHHAMGGQALGGGMNNGDILQAQRNRGAEMLKNLHNIVPSRGFVANARLQNVPQGPFARSKGGSCYAEGGEVEHKSKGGRTHHRRSRHAEGGEPMNKLQSRLNEIKEYYPNKYKKGGHCYAEGGEAKEYGEKPLEGQLRKGGRAKGRQHHYWGQSVIGRLPLIGGIANSIANTAGTLDPHKYGGAEYVAKSKGQKAADIFSTIGNLGANIALSKGGAKKSKGGGVHHKYRHHHAEGGAGKVRKGMMTESGRMIHSRDD